MTAEGLTAGLEAPEAVAPDALEIVSPVCQVPNGTPDGTRAVPQNEHVRAFIRASKAENTLRGYQADWRDFCAWCGARSLAPIPAAPDALAAYIADCAARLKPGSIQRRLNAIAEAHKAAGIQSPTHAGVVRNVLKGIRRTLGTAPVQKAAALTPDIRAMIDVADAGLIGTRDRALILLGFAGAFRRSELVGLDVADCAFSKDGLPSRSGAPRPTRTAPAGRSGYRMARIRRRARSARSGSGSKCRASPPARSSGRCHGTARSSLAR
jgi:site-specific recombinase XerD